MNFDRRAVQECAHDTAIALLDAAGHRLSPEDRREMYRQAFDRVQEAIEPLLSRPPEKHRWVVEDRPEES